MSKTLKSIIFKHLNLVADLSEDFLPPSLPCLPLPEECNCLTWGIFWNAGTKEELVKSYGVNSVINGEHPPFPGGIEDIREATPEQLYQIEQGMYDLEYLTFNEGNRDPRYFMPRIYRDPNSPNWSRRCTFIVCWLQSEGSNEEETPEEEETQEEEETNSDDRAPVESPTFWDSFRHEDGRICWKPYIEQDIDSLIRYL